jgi:competence protein ComEC
MQGADLPKEPPGNLMKAKSPKAFRLPLIPVFLSYGAGIVLGHFDLPLPLDLLSSLLLVFLTWWAFCLIFKKSMMGSIIAGLVFFAIGVFSIQLYIHPPLSPSHISRFNGSDRIRVEGIVAGPPELSERGTRLLIRSETIHGRDSQIPVYGEFLLFIRDQNVAFLPGDRLRFLCSLYSPREFRNPGGFSYRRHLAYERIHTIAYLPEKNTWVQTGSGIGNPLLLKVEGWRSRIRWFLQRQGDFLSTGICQALVIGEQGMVPQGVRDLFTTTGIAHLLAISGDQFGIIAFLAFSVLFWVVKRSERILLSGAAKKLTAAMTIPLLVVYTLIAGGGISVVRAMIMVTTFFLSILFDRERNLLHTLVLAAFLILIISPPSLFDVSFQLSFLAVLSIVYLIPLVVKRFTPEKPILPDSKSRLEKLWRYGKIAFLVTTVATLGTAPFVALHFNRLSPVGLITNLFAVPWVGFLLLPLSLAASVLSFFSFPVAAILMQANGLIAKGLVSTLGLFASIPFASFFVSTPTWVEIMLFYLLLFTFVHIRKKKATVWAFLILCVLAALDFSYWTLRGSFQKNLVVTFLDVGHGDSILVEFPKGKKMLIDGGGFHDERLDTGKHIVAPFLWKSKIHTIDYMVLTHPDPDHLKGLGFIASHFKIGQFWSNNLPIPTEPLELLKETLSREGVAKREIDEAHPALAIHGVQISVLNPRAGGELPHKSPNPLFLNNQSLVLKFEFRNITLLLPADIGQEAEYRMMRKGYLLKADLLKVPHHGSASSSSPLFLEKVRPEYAIFSVGERSRGRLPNPEVLARYLRAGAKVFRTDRDGAITVVTDGEKLQVKTFVKS